MSNGLAQTMKTQQRNDNASVKPAKNKFGQVRYDCPKCQNQVWLPQNVRATVSCYRCYIEDKLGNKRPTPMRKARGENNE